MGFGEKSGVDLNLESQFLLQESKAAEPSKKSRVAIIVLVLMCLVMAALTVYSMTFGCSPKELPIASEQCYNDTDNER